MFRRTWRMAGHAAAFARRSSVHMGSGERPLQRTSMVVRPPPEADAGILPLRHSVRRGNNKMKLYVKQGTNSSSYR